MEESYNMKPLLIAHRGAKREAPENTIIAFERALASGCDGVEFDVLLTKDRVPIITHNNDLSILTNCDGLIHSTPFSMLKTLDFGSHFHASFANVIAPTLTEVLELLQPHDVSIICEIKIQPGLAFHAAQLVGGIISDFKFRRQVVISSLSPRILFHLSRIVPDIKRALIIKKTTFPFLRAHIFDKFLMLSEFHVCFSILTSPFIEKAKPAGKQISAWTVNRPEDVRRCASLGVDSIITDDIGMARKALDSQLTALS